MGSDQNFQSFMQQMRGFLSTPPAWGATKRRGDPVGYRLISIHAPRMGSDSKHGEKSALFAFVCCAK